MRDRKQLRSHIRAARDWLGQADRSLERENDLQGDLKLMLAQAELQRAKEALPEPAWRRWGRRLLPLAVAGVLAAVLWLPQETPEATDERGGKEAAYVPPPAMAIQETLPPSVGEGEPDALELEQPETPLLPEAVEAQERPLPVQKEAEPLRETEPLGEEATTQESAEKASPPGNAGAGAKVPKVPSEDMQKLMQSAGKVLRAE